MTRILSYFFTIALLFVVGGFASAQNKNEAAFLKAKKFADSVYQLNQIENALGAYKYALKLKGSDSNIELKISELQRLIDQQRIRKGEIASLLREAKVCIIDGKLEEAVSKLDQLLELDASHLEAKKLRDETTSKIMKDKDILQKFNGFLSSADEFLAAKNYEGALESINNALKIRDKDQIALKKLEQINLLKSNAENEYAALLEKANSSAEANNFQEAISYYQKASTTLPLRSEAKAKIAELNALLDYQKEVDAIFQKAVEEGNKLLALGKTAEAINKYRQAIDVKPDEELPKTKIREIENAALAAQTVEKNYSEAIKNGETAMTLREYENAKKSFTYALELKPNADLPKAKLKQIEDILTKLLQLDIQFNQLMSQADQLFGENKLAEARLKYADASGLKPDENRPKEQMALIDKQMAERELRFNDLVKQAETQASSGDYASAIATLDQALEIKPGDQAVTTRQNELRTLMTQTQEKEQAYANLMTQADQLFGENKLVEARLKYADASGLKPEENRPKEQMALIDKQMAERELQFNDLVKQAETQASSGDYASAIATLDQALEIKPGDQAVTTRQNELRTLMTQTQEKEQAYAALMSQADQLFGENKLAEARLKYADASGLKPEENRPKEQIALIDKQMAERELQFNDLVKQAETQASSGDYASAIATLDQALEIKPGDQAVTTRLNELRTLMTQTQEKEQAYAALISQADQLFGENKLAEARLKYADASGLKPEENRPKEQIALIDKQMAERELRFNDLVKQAETQASSGDYASAIATLDQALEIKPGDQAVTTRQNELRTLMTQTQEKEQAYANLMTQADQLFGENKLAEARLKYTDASGLKPEENRPKEQMALIDKQMAERELRFNDLVKQAETQASSGDYASAIATLDQALEIKPGDQAVTTRQNELRTLMTQTQEKEQAYAALISQADQLFGENKLVEARLKYADASGLKPEENRPKEQMALIDKQMAERELRFNDLVKQAETQASSGDYASAIATLDQALEIKPGDQAVTTRQNELRTLMTQTQEKEQAYAALMSQADQLFGENKLAEARLKYTDASGLKPEENRPKEQMALIDKQMAERELRFNDLVKQAETQASSGDYASAIATLDQALEIKPGDQAVTTRQNELRTLMTQTQEKEQAYATLMSHADQLFGENKLAEARLKYADASGLKPEENRPKEQMALIDKQMAERELRFNDLVKQAETQASSGDYASAIATLDQALEIKPGDQAVTTRQNELRTLMTQTQEKEQAYAALMSQADQLFGENKLAEARLKYTDASGLKPEENRPKEQMALIDSKISSQKAIDDQVAFLIIKGDQQLADSLPENAIEYYSQALTLFPDYLIAKEKIEEAKQFSINLAKNKREFNDLILNADQLFKAGELDEAESSYRQALSIQKTAAYPKSQIQLIEKERIRLGGIASNYKEAISQANASEAEGNLLSAVGSYKKALTYLPGDSLAVEAINRLSKSIQENEERENRYKGYLAEAGFKVQSNDKKGAIELFRAAQLLFPDRDFPAIKIKELEEQIQAESNLETNYAQLITHADELFAIGSLVESRKAYQESLGLKASASYPIQQIRTIDSTIQVKTDQQSLHSKLLKTADNYLTAGNLTMARETYQKTLDLPLDHTYSLQRITFIDSVENVRLSKQTRYNELIVNADRYFQDNNLQEARSLYETASNIFPSEPHPQTRLIEIKNQLDAIQKNEQQFIDKMNQAADFFRNGHLVESRKTYESARAYNMEAELITSKIKHIDSLIDSQLKENQAYNQYIENGNAAFDAQRYEDARLFFAKAQEIKPQNSYPAEKIASINQIFADRQAAISTAYNQAVADADKLLAADEQEEAVKAYERALGIIPADEYATQQIEKAKDQILKKQLNKLAYNELIKSADSKLSTENYTEARSLYIQASDIYPFENYPRTQAEFIDIKLDELNRMEQQFQQLVLKGDSLFDSEQFQQAAMAYTQALVIKPDMYASERAALSNQYFTEVSQKSKIYTDLIAFGDNYLKMKDYINAIKQYELAFNILPMRDEAVTRKERAEADMELEKLTFKNYQRSIQQADSLTINQQWVEAISFYQKACEFKQGDYYATSKISELKRTIAENNRRVVEYEKFIKQADSLYAIDELKKALPFYEKASRLFTEDNYPKSRISEIAAILSQPESMRGISYLDVIKKADSLFEARRYEKSTDLYLLAQSLKPAEEYPVIRLQETFEKLGMVTRVPILGQTTKLYVDETAKVVINKDIPQKDQQQYLVIRTQATDSVNTKLIINYGDKFSGNGGFVHTIPNNDGYSLYVGCLTDQSGWKGKPVEWMTFFAENGIITIQEIFIVTLP